jgi:non-heme chloroperoxidase
VFINKYYESFFKTTDNIDIHYYSNFDPKDNKKPRKNVIIFNYGLVCNVGHYEHQVLYFDKLGFDILLHNYRGHYESSGEESLSEITFENIANDLNQIIIDLKITNYFMIGHSMGVNVSLEYAYNYPKSLTGMILISGAPVSTDDIMLDSNIMSLFGDYWRMLPKKIPGLYEKFWQTSSQNPIIFYLIYNNGFNTKFTSKKFVETYLKKMGELPMDLFFQMYDQMNKQNALAYLNKIKTPTLLMSGDQDKVIPLYQQFIMKEKIENSEFYLIKDGSHVPQNDFPETTNERINIFIQQHLV